MIWVLAIILTMPLCASAGSLSGGKISGGSEGVDIWDRLIRCSTLPDPSEPEFTLGAEDLHDFITANCASGCIVNVPPGTYDDVRVTIGDATAAEFLRAGSLSNATGTILIRGTDPANPPVLRAVVGGITGVFWFQNLSALVRLEDVILDGRRSEQTVGAVYDVCDDVAENGGLGDGQCDPGGQSFSHATGFSTRMTNLSDSRSCLLRVQVRETLTDAIFLRQARDSTVEASRVLGAGCTTDLCPALVIPADPVSDELTFVGRGVNFDSARGNVVAVGNRTKSVSKIGLQCISSVDCHIVGNVAIDSHTAGITAGNGSSGSIRGNTILDTGLWEGTDPVFNVGQGIQWTDSDGISNGLTVIDGNFISNSLGPSIMIAVGIGAGDNDAELIVSRNVSSGACNGGTRSSMAAIELGDGSDSIASIWSIGNSVGDHDCDSAFRVQRATEYRARRNVVSGASTAPAVIYDDVPAIDETGLVVDEDIQIDAGSAGSISDCTLNEGAIVSDASGGAVERMSCGP